MIEIHWGEPISLSVPTNGDTHQFSTIEKARYWLRRKWPVADAAQGLALQELDAAMNCMTPVSTARRAFMNAAQSAGFVATVGGH